MCEMNYFVYFIGCYFTEDICQNHNKDIFYSFKKSNPLIEFSYSFGM